MRGKKEIKPTILRYRQVSFQTVPFRITLSQGLQHRFRKWDRCLVHEPVLSFKAEIHNQVQKQKQSIYTSEAPSLAGTALPLCLCIKSIPWSPDLLPAWGCALITVLSHSPAYCLALSILFLFTQLGSFRETAGLLKPRLLIVGTF